MNFLIFIKLHPEIVLLVLLLVSLLVYSLIRYPIYILSYRYFSEQKPSTAGSQPITVVVVAHNHGDVLEENLHLMATQDYPAFEIVVVNDASTDDTADIITRTENRFRNVHHTFTPTTARHVSHSKLSITLGVLAAQNEWIVLTGGDCHPVTNRWLSALASAMKEGTDFVLGYSNFSRVGSLLNARLRLDRLVRLLRYFHAALPSFGRGKAVGALNANIAFRKSLFLKEKGFYNQLALLGGEEILFVDHAAKKGRTAVVCDAEARVEQKMPLLSQTRFTQRIIEAEAERHLGLKGKLERALWALSSWCVYAGLVSVGLLLFLFIKNQAYIVAALTLLLAFFVFIIGNYLLNRSARRLGEGTFYFLFPLYDLTKPFFGLYYRMSSRRHRRDLMRGF